MADESKLNEALARDIARVVEDSVKPKLAELRDSVAKLEDGQEKAAAVQARIDALEEAQKAPRTKLPDGTPTQKIGGEGGRELKHWFSDILADQFGGRDLEADIKASLVHGQTGTAGGYVVPDEYRGGIFKVMGSYGKARQVATVLPMASDTIRIPTGTTSVTVYFPDSMGSSITGTTPEFGEIALTAKTMAVYTQAANEFVDDSAQTVDIADYLLGQCLNQKACAEDTWVFGETLAGAALPACEKALLAGTGAGGLMLNAGATTGASAFATPVIGSTTAVLAETPHNIISLPGYVVAGAYDDGAWLMHRTIWTAIRANFGATVPHLGDLAQDGPTRTLMGYPVILSDVCPSYSTASGNTDEQYLVFGRMKSIFIGDRQDYRFQLSDQYKFQTNETAFRLTSRMHWGAAGNSTTTWAHFAQLITAAS